MSELWLSLISPCQRIVGYGSMAPYWVEPMRVIYDHELVLFAGADYVVEIDGVRYDCPRDSFIIVPPGIRHVSREVSGLRGVRRWIHFDWTYAGDASHVPWMTYSPARPDESLFRPAPDFVPKEILRGPVPAMRRAIELFTRVDSLFNGGIGREVCVSRGLLLELLLELLAPDSLETPRKGPSLRLASKIRRDLEAFAARPFEARFSLQDYMEETGSMSYAHQCRVFKSCYGISPLKYVTEQRMTRVKALLRDTERPISEIAALSGFDNLCYFARLFNKSAGMSAREYRRRERAAAGD
jgi:AraC-like DNA-binding protein